MSIFQGGLIPREFRSHGFCQFLLLSPRTFLLPLESDRDSCWVHTPKYLITIQHLLN